MKRLLKLARYLLWLMVGLAGFGLGVRLAGAMDLRVGPVDTRVTLQPRSETVLGIPPFGLVSFDSHDGWFGVKVEVVDLDRERLAVLAQQPDPLVVLAEQATRDVKHGIWLFVIRLFVAGGLGTLLLSVIIWRRWRPVVVGTTITMVLALGTLQWAQVSFRPDAINQPKFIGALEEAQPILSGFSLDQANLQAYQAKLGELVGNVTRIYESLGNLPATTDGEITAVLFVTDIHSSVGAFGTIASVAEQFGVDLVIDGGDLTNSGLPFEQVLFAGIEQLDVPYLFVKGNHDSSSTVAAVSQFANATVLDGQPVEVMGLRILGGSDPLYTPNQAGRDLPEAEAALVRAAGDQLAEIARADGNIDLAVAHNPVAGEQLGGVVPLVLSGHAHQRRLERIEQTLLYIEGSAGGVGDPDIETGEPPSLLMSVLYFDPATRRLVAYDQITIGGLGLTRMTVERTTVE
ncbi:metallophosphoesterase family protein [Candidatus Microgenomates bacterium]|nr:metallophosphoesterase family protein [Candidatus Microgenomates bacterium]